ncbi:unnamed protein product [Polarella glacialis]|uniref:Dienelactone hydrolase domain-containing protein n=1 Tax=Polarella glacialis TaxID=89957 RepID=A0A813DF27_POLGL|nr:unnamed protein product [Polarella glacialis]
MAVSIRGSRPFWLKLVDVRCSRTVSATTPSERESPEQLSSNNNNINNNINNNNNNMALATTPSCCPPGAWPALAAPKDYIEKGRSISIGGTECYVSGSLMWGTGIIVMHDVFGPHSGNHKGLCDQLAAGGHYVIMPDFFNGGSMEPYYAAKQVTEGKQWLKQFNWAYCSKKLEPVHAHLSENAVSKVGSIGFCWGAWAVAKVCQDPSKVQAGVWAHPSCQVGKELYEGETEHELASAVRAPTLILASPQEPEFYSNGELANIMNCNAIPNDLVFFKDQAHGWVVRAAGFLGRSWEDCSTSTQPSV